MAKWDFDIIPRAKANAMVAAALTEAAEIVKARLMQETDGLGLLVANRTQEAIRALIDASADAALTRMLAEAEAKGMREAAKEAYYACGCQDNILIAADAIKKEGGT